MSAMSRIGTAGRVTPLRPGGASSLCRMRRKRSLSFGHPIIEKWGEGREFMVNRLHCTAFAAIAYLAASGAAVAQGAATMAPEQEDAERLADLVLANHILADQAVLDGFGHVSVRSARSPDHYFISRSRAPALVAAADIMEFDLDDNAIDARGRASYSERFIHSEIYKARPDVQAVVHSHSPAVIPYGVSTVPLTSRTWQAFSSAKSPCSRSARREG